MILVQAVKLATAQRHAVRKIAQHVKGDFVIDDKIKMLNIKFEDLKPNKDVYKNSAPKRLSEFAKKIADATGEFSKNPIKKITSWIKCYVQNVKDLFNAKQAEKAAKAANIATKAEPAPVVEPEK